MEPTNPPAPRTARTRIALLFWVALTLSLLVLMMGAPAWAASGPVDLRQGTVPILPPDSGGGNSGGGDNDNSNSPLTATATPGAPAPSASTAATSAISLSAPANESGLIVAPRLNMRAGAGVGFPVVGRVVQSQTVTIQYRNAAGDWWYTCCATGTTTSGWVNALYVRPTSFDRARANEVLPVAGNVPPAGATPAAATPDDLRGTVAVTRLNLREQPSTQGAIVGKLTQGTTVRINSRSDDNTWWYICCVVGLDGTSNVSGWVSAEMLEPNFARADAARLLPVFEQVSVVLPTPTPRPGAQPAAAATALPTTTLALAVVQEPAFVAPGGLLLLHYTITNTGDAPAVAVELRSELTPTIALVGGEAGGNGLLRQSKTAAGRTVVAATWPILNSGSVVTATVAYTVADDVPEGSLIDSIAAASAQNAAAQTGGVRTGMPPAALPDFK